MSPVMRRLSEVWFTEVTAVRFQRGIFWQGVIHILYFTQEMR